MVLEGLLTPGGAGPAAAGAGLARGRGRRRLCVVLSREMFSSRLAQLLSRDVGQMVIAFSPPHIELVRRLREVVPPGIAGAGHGHLLRQRFGNRYF